MKSDLVLKNAKKVFSPIPGAITNGLFARKAIQREPIAEMTSVRTVVPFYLRWNSLSMRTPPETEY